MEPQTIIQTTGLTKRYDHQTAVDHLDFQVVEGEIFGFLGPNGAGKTTTLLMLLGLSRPTEGTATVCGLDPERKAMEVKKIVGYLPENVGFYGDMDAVQSLRYIAELNRIPGSEAEDRIHEVLKLVGLAENGVKKVSAFSRGMKQRLGVAEVLLKQPKVMFLDEPTLGLDPDGAVRLIELIQSLNQERGITVLLSSHHLQQVQKISHRVGIMIKGRMVAAGSVEALAREKFGVGEEKFTLEEIYMKYFQEV
ncbi:MAG: ABC transporter ATP-binding protein [Deltaproteobacteria bacterium]|jgi:ABC-2 type transport system ATP-binding protein|nr:ABC transporter ATP-binding protein [Deltaproteobacteria bacterium]NTV57623.1 ABC transporter ATP-binding protein [Deltaproteobacteria bacterium]